jgi:hypothetical protein
MASSKSAGFQVTTQCLGEVAYLATLLGKHLEFLNNPNLLQRRSLNLVEHTDLVSLNCCCELHSGTILLSQMNSSLGTQNYYVILRQPIHAKDYIYALGIYDDEVRQKVYPLWQY